jgi:antitoxin ParD1/3/4
MLMNVSLTPELEQFLQRQVEDGKYKSPQEVILAALRAFAERERIYKGRFEELREEIMVGVEASRRGEVVDGETVFSQLEQKLLLRRSQAGE